MRISQFSEKNQHKQLIIKQGINKHRELGNTVEEHRALFEDGLGNSDCSKQNWKNIYKINISQANVSSEQSKILGKMYNKKYRSRKEHGRENKISLLILNGQGQSS